jgi:hypothetical protein
MEPRVASRARVRALDVWLLGGSPGLERFTWHALVLPALCALGLLWVVVVGGRVTLSAEHWLMLPGVLVGLVLGRIWVRRIDRR